MKKIRAIFYIILFLGAIGLLIWYLSGLVNSQLDQQPQTSAENKTAAESKNAASPVDSDQPTSQDKTAETVSPAVISSTATTAGTNFPEVSTVKLASLDYAYFETIGTVTSKGTVSLYPLTSGSVKKVNFQEGDYVKEGDVILEIAGSNQTEHLSATQLAIAETSLANAKSAYESLKKSSAESLQAAALQLQSATNQVAALQYDLQSIEENRSALEDALRLLQDSFYNTQDINDRDQYKSERDIDSLIFTLNAAQDDRSRNQRKLDDFQDQLESLQSPNTDTSDPQIAALQAQISQLQTALAAQDKGIEELYIAIDKSKYGYSTAENGAYLGENQIQGQILQTESQAQTLDLTLQSTITKLGYTGDSSDGLLLAKQAYQATKTQLQSALDSAAYGVKLAELNVELAKSQATALQIKAPLAGLLTMLDLYPGQNVNPQLAVAEVIDPQSFQLKVGLDLNTAERLSVSTPALIELAGRSIEVPIKSVSPKVDDRTKLVNVTLTLPNIFFKINQTLKVKLPLSTKSLIAGDGSTSRFIPLDAVIIGTESQFVYVNDNGKAKKVEVKIGQVSGDQIEIISGLPADAEIIVTGAKRLTDGQQINSPA